MRLFIATTFPSGVLRDLNDRIVRFKSRLPAASWARPETQHLTLAFLGEQPEGLIEKLTPPLGSSIADVPRFEAVMQGCGYFPNPRRARVGWIGLEPVDRFCALANAVREVVTKNGVELDRADFKPHLTVMRMRDTWPPSSIELFSKSMRDYRSESFVVDTVTLYSSQLHPNGAIHTPQRTFALK
jgi:2'-5' RNA ligase